MGQRCAAARARAPGRRVAVFFATTCTRTLPSSSRTWCGCIGTTSTGTSPSRTPPPLTPPAAPRGARRGHRRRSRSIRRRRRSERGPRLRRGRFTGIGAGPGPRARPAGRVAHGPRTALRRFLVPIGAVVSRPRKRGVALFGMSVRAAWHYDGLGSCPASPPRVGQHFRSEVLLAGTPP